MRKKRENIKKLNTAKLIISLSSDQCFYETPKAYEIWTNDIIDGKALRIHRIDKKRVFFVTEN